MAEDPRPALTNLRKRLGEAAEAIGLPLEAFAIIDDPERGHVVQAVFHLDPEVAFAEPEQRAIDEQFAEMAAHDRLHSMEQKKREAAAKLVENLAELDAEDGIGLDD